MRRPEQGLSGHGVGLSFCTRVPYFSSSLHLSHFLQRRIWCLFEYLHALVSGADLEIFLPTAELKQGLDGLDSLAVSMDVRQAEASRPADIAMIHAEIEALMGMDAMNSRLRQALKDGAAQVQSQLEQVLQLEQLF